MTRTPKPLLWASGGFSLTISGTGTGASRRELAFDRPFAVLGRSPGGDLVIDDPAVSGRHVYFHLGRRGLFAVDLATRTGTRVGPNKAPCGWLSNPGDSLEVAGTVIELGDWHVDHDDFDRDSPENPLDDAGPDAPLARFILYPETPPRDPLALESRLVFAGRSASCGVPIDGDSAMRVQCVLVRGNQRGFVVDLVGRGTWRNEQPVRGAEPIYDGDTLMVGASRFQCRVMAPGTIRPMLPALALGVGAPAPAEGELSTILEGIAEPPLHLIPPESQAAVLGWMLGQIQARQDESIRSQSQFQVELVRLVADIQRDNHDILSRHLEHAESIHREIADLRQEIKMRFGTHIPRSGESSREHPSSATPPGPAPPKLPPSGLKLPAPAPPENPEAAALWLIARANQLDRDSRGRWKDLLGRLSGRKDS